MFDDLSDMAKETLAFIAGTGLIGIGAFWYFFMMDDIYEKIYLMAIFVIILSFLMVFFYLFDIVCQQSDNRVNSKEYGMQDDSPLFGSFHHLLQSFH